MNSYFKLKVAPEEEFTSYIKEDITKKSKIVMGKLTNGMWKTTKWLIHKDDAHLKNGKLIADNSKLKKVINILNKNMRKLDDENFIIEY
jgi:hypothetical protein